MPRRRGYTLFELVLVMAIMLIVASVGAPLVMDALYGDTKVNAAADLVRGRWADCRAQAIEEGRPYRFAVVPNTGKFKIEPYQGVLAPNSAFLSPDDSGGGDQTANGNGSSGGSDSPGLVIEDTLPKGVRFSTKDSPASTDGPESDGGDYVTIAVFLPDGTTQEDVEVAFGGNSSLKVTLRLRAFTGSATTIRPKGDEGP